MGIRGVVLAFAREASSSTSDVSSPKLHPGEPALRAWVQFNLRTIEKLKAGDYLAVRCTGAGNSVLKCMDDFYALVQDVGYDQALKQAAREIEVFSSAMHEICAAAQQSGIKVLVDAEDIRRQTLIDHIGLVCCSLAKLGLCY